MKNLNTVDCLNRNTEVQSYGLDLEFDTLDIRSSKASFQQFSSTNTFLLENTRLVILFLISILLFGRKYWNFMAMLI